MKGDFALAVAQSLKGRLDESAAVICNHSCGEIEEGQSDYFITYTGIAKKIIISVAEYPLDKARAV